MIRTFSGETWICGWFSQEDGSLMDIQQYSTEQEAMRTSELFKNSYPTFVGRIVDVTEGNVLIPNPEGENMTGIASYVDPEFLKGRSASGNSHHNENLEKHEKYLRALFESQKAGHEVHFEISEALAKYKNELGL